MRIFALFPALIALVMALPASAGQLSLDQIESSWKAVGKTNGTFTEAYADGFRRTGTFSTDGPSRLTWNYPAQGGYPSMKAWIASQKFQYQEAGKGVKEYPLGPLKPMFRRDVNLRSGVVTHLGYEPSKDLTYVVIRDSREGGLGEGRVYFTSAGRMVYWDITNDQGERIVTEFRY